MPILVTGAAGFVGFHVAQALLANGDEVVGIDNLNEYYDVRLKHARLAQLESRRGFRFVKLDISNDAAMDDFARGHPEIERVVHLAAQAGVRYSLQFPREYVKSNLAGHLNILEFARNLPRLNHLVFASSSSVYGANEELPFSESDRVDTPLSLYAATKRSDELMSYAYGHLFGLPQTGLRFFTVYGPWGRPDMAYFLFADAIVAGRPITVYEGGTLRRDFTYIDDIVEGVVGALHRPPTGEGGLVPIRVLNIGNHRSEAVSTLIALLENSLERRAVIAVKPRPRADVAETFADIERIRMLTGYEPRTSLSQGIPRFAAWFLRWKGNEDAPLATWSENEG